MKKYISGEFVATQYGIYKAAQDKIISFPSTIIANGANASAVIKGNMQQSGPPTPTTPIYPTGCGDKTANLFNYASIITGYRIQWLNGEPHADSTAIMSDYISVNNGTYSTDIGYIIIGYDANKDYVGVYDGVSETWIKQLSTGVTIFTVDANSGVKYVKLLTYGSMTSLSDTTMFNTGSTALPYEPYVYKIPIVSGGTTTNVYLGNVQSTRSIKKVILTGNETWYTNTSASTENTIYVYTTEVTDAISYNSICSHYQFNTNSLLNDSDCFQIISGYGALRFRTARTIANDSTEWKTYLQQQYTNGTPVTVWYVLGTPTTGIINEPIKKIGDYADSVSVSAIPTTATTQTFNVDTTLKPSEVDLTYTGWHMYDDKKYSGSEWG